VKNTVSGDQAFVNKFCCGTAGDNSIWSGVPPPPSYLVSSDRDTAKCPRSCFASGPAPFPCHAPRMRYRMLLKATAVMVTLELLSCYRRDGTVLLLLSQLFIVGVLQRTQG